MKKWNHHPFLITSIACVELYTVSFRSNDQPMLRVTGGVHQPRWSSWPCDCYTFLKRHRALPKMAISTHFGTVTVFKSLALRITCTKFIQFRCACYTLLNTWSKWYSTCCYSSQTVVQIIWISLELLIMPIFYRFAIIISLDSYRTLYKRRYGRLITDDKT